MIAIIHADDQRCLFAPVPPRHERIGIELQQMARSSNNMSLDRNEARAAVSRPDTRSYQPASQQPRADYLKLVILLAMIFLPWAGIAFLVRLAFAAH